MNENDRITCDICRDLLPLVKDGVASADSEAAVLRHIKDCAECGALYESAPPACSAPAPPNMLLKAKRWLTGIYIVLMMFGIYFGFSLTGSEDLFFNCLIMPVVGVFGYLVFRWKALFMVPLVLLIYQTAANALGLFREAGGLEVMDILSWTFIYSLFALAGAAVAMLLRFAFGKHSFERGNKNEK